MRPLPFCGALAAAVALASPAGAVDWSLDGTFGQSFSAAYTPGFEPGDDGNFYGTSTNLGLTLGARTQRTDWTLSSGARLNFFGGEGATEDLETPEPRLDGSVRHRGQRFTLNGNFGFVRESTTFDALSPFALDEPDPGAPPEEAEDLEGDALIDANAVRNRLSLGAGWAYSLSRLDTIQLSASGSITRFTGDTAEDDDLRNRSTVGTTIAYDRRISRLSSLGVTASASRFTSDDDEQTRATTLTAAGTYATRVTEAIDFNTSLGVSYTDLDRIPQDDTVIGFTGGLEAVFRRPDSVAIRVFADQQVLPSGLTGEVRNVTSFGASYTEALTTRTSLSIGARHVIGTELAGEDDDLSQSFTFSPALSYQISRNWSASVSYTLRVFNEDDDTEIGNRVFLGFSRGFTLLR